MRGKLLIYQKCPFLVFFGATDGMKINWTRKNCFKRANYVAIGHATFLNLIFKTKSSIRFDRYQGTKCYLGVFLGKKIYNSTPLYNHETRYKRMSECYYCFVEFGCEKLVFKLFFRVNLVSYRHGFEEKSLSSRLASVSKKAFLKNFIHFLQ